MVQEVILEEAALQCCSEHGWTVLAHRQQSEWRGTGIAFRATEFTHIDTPTTATASIATTLHTKAGNQIHALSIHLPHHATLEQTHQLIRAWQDNHPQLQRHPCIIGADWNETFHTTSQAATTARGDIILDWLSQHKQYMPQQRDDVPSYHPYNTTMRSRRLDYVSTSRKVLAHAQPIPGSRDLASSDHEAVTATLTTKATSNQLQQKLTHHPMKIKALGARLPNPPPSAHPWDSLTVLAMQVTEAYPKQRFQESGRLKQHRHKLVSGQIPQDQQRQRWKLTQAAHEREKKRWDHAQAIQAAKGDWQAYRQSMQKPQQMQWGHKLILNQDWEKIPEHFQATARPTGQRRNRSYAAPPRTALQRDALQASARTRAARHTSKMAQQKSNGTGQSVERGPEFFLVPLRHRLKANLDLRRCDLQRPKPHPRLTRHHSAAPQNRPPNTVERHPTHHIKQHH